MKGQKDPYFQVIRGICICAVILIHCQAQGHSVAAEYYQIVLRQIINFAVATFIFMAAFFAHPYKLSGGGYWNRLKKLLIPYILWSIFYSVLNSPNGFNPIEIIYNLMTGRAQAQLYYILVLVELTLLTPLLMKAVDNKKMSVLILSITPVYLLLTTGYRYITGNELSWMGRDFCAWLIFYYFGLLVKHYDWKRRNNYFLYVLYIIALIFSVVEGLLANSLEMFSLAISQVKISSMLYSLAAIALIMNRWLILKDRKLYQKSRKSAPPGFTGKIIHSLVYIGDISFGIYFCHTLVLKCVTFVLERIGVMEIFSLPFIQLLQFFLTLILSVIGIIIVQKIDKKRKLCPYIGF